MRPEAVPDVLAKVILERRLLVRLSRRLHVRLEQDVRDDPLAALLVRHPADGGVCDCRGATKCGFDRRWTDPVPRGDDQVVGPTREGHVAVFVQPCQIAGEIPAAVIALLGRLLITEIACKEDGIRALECDLADRSRFDRLEVLVENRTLVPG